MIALEVVEHQVSSLERWVERHLDDAVTGPLAPYIQVLAQVRTQDLETVVVERRGESRDLLALGHLRIVGLRQHGLDVQSRLLAALEERALTPK